MRKILILLSFVLISSQAFARVHSYFSPEHDLEEVITEHLKLANKRVDIAIYTFSSDGMREVLLDKLQKGIEVRILVDDGHKKKVRDFVEPLILKGAEVRYLTQINHHKFVLLDNEILLNTSINFASYHLFKKYDENLTVCSTCIELVEAFKNEFESLLKFSNFVIKTQDTQNPKPTDYETRTPVHQNIDGVALFTSSNFTPYYQQGKVRTKSNDPDSLGMGNVDSYLVDVISRAQHSVWVATGHLRSKPLYDALVRAHERGVDVQVVLDGQEYISASKQRRQRKEIEECLKTQSEVECYLKGNHFGRLVDTAGINVLFKYNLFKWHFPYAEQMHHKYMIVDQKEVYSGSYNWSHNAEFNTFENVSIFRGSEVVKDFTRNFKKLQSYGGAEKGFQRFLKEIQSAKSKVELVFEPIALTVKQIDTLRREVLKKCKKLYQLPREAKTCYL